MSSQQNNRRIFRIEVGNIPADALRDYIQKLKDSLKKKSLFLEPSNNVYKRELLPERTLEYIEIPFTTLTTGGKLYDYLDIS